MGSETKTNAGNGSAAGGFRAKIDKFLYSGDKKHVLTGLAALTVVFGAPWYLMNRGTKHRSHQDYLEKADKARSERLSASTK